MAIKNLEFGRDDADAKDRYIPGVIAATKGVNIEQRTVTGVASTIKIDRDGEIILPSAFKKHAQIFLASNAPFATSHMHRLGDGKPSQIGWVMSWKLSKVDVTADFRFAATSVAEDWWKLASDAAGKGIAFSIGFLPIRAVIGSAADLVAQFPEIADSVREAKLRDSDQVRVYTEIELYEISAVMCPSNRQAVQLLEAKLFAGADAKDAPAIIEQLRRAWADETATIVRRELAAVEDRLTILADKASETLELLTLSPEMGDGHAAGDAPAGGSNGRSTSGDDGATREAARRLAAKLQRNN